ncbi:DUF664 domain-containing protein [Streptomyces sp. NPDC060031]|uniref:mycothiol transferase n=1 Tax=Streptomyces sp. NPDC060031 TaxID=3347043 RepID=UPI003676D80D
MTSRTSPDPGPSRRAGLSPRAESERRFDGPATGDERRMITDMLAAQRTTLLLKCSALGPELSLRPVSPSTLSLLGLVRRLADVERRWFRRVLAKEDAPALFSSQDDPDGDFDGAADAPGVITGSWEARRAEVAYPRFAVRGSRLTALRERPRHQVREERPRPPVRVQVRVVDGDVEPHAAR